MDLLRLCQCSAGRRIQEEQQQAISEQAEAANSSSQDVGKEAADRLPLIVHCISTVLMSISYGFLGPVLATELQAVLGAGAFVTGAVFAIGAVRCLSPRPEVHAWKSPVRALILRPLRHRPCTSAWRPWSVCWLTTSRGIGL